MLTRLTSSTLAYYGLLLAVTLAISAQRVEALDSISKGSASFLVLPLLNGSDTDPTVLALAGELERALVARQYAVLPAERAVARFTAVDSAEPTPVSQDDFDLFVENANKANQALANHHMLEAKLLLDKSWEHMRRAGETLARDARGQESAFKYCVNGIRTSLQEHDAKRAQNWATFCLSLLPDMDWTNASMPSVVLAELTQAQAAIDSAGIGALVVEATQEDCTVRLNGRNVGQAPYRLDHPVPGEHKIQVECGTQQPGRTHLVRVGRNVTRVSVDVLFDRAVHTGQGRIHLAYAQPDEALATAHARHVAQLVGAKEVITVSSEAPARIVLQRLRGLHADRVSLASPHSAPSLDGALNQLLRPDGTEAANLTEHGGSGTRQPRDWRLKVGIPLASAGILALGVAYGLLAREGAAGSEFQATLPNEPGYIDRQQEWHDQRPWPYVAGALGMSSASAGISMLATKLEPSQFIWLTATSAALGTTLLAVGAQQVRSGSACAASDDIDRRFCASDRQQRDRGALLLMTAAPFLSLPVTQLTRWLWHTERRSPVNLGASASTREYQVVAEAVF